MPKYEIIFYRDEVDNCYIADVPELPGCKAHGNSYDEALNQIKEAITLWVDTTVEFGDPIPEAKGRRTRVCVGLRKGKAVIVLRNLEYDPGLVTL